MESSQNGTKTPSNASFQIPAHILDDLCSRFIINIPEEERQDLIRIFFQIELAHWFYLDFYCQEQPELKACGIKEFSKQVFRHCPTLSNHADNVDLIMGSWREYKMAVPTYGAIMLDPTMQHCVLVQGFWSKASWGFPKGKVNEGEQPQDCAVREVLEETGFDISSLIDKDLYREVTIHDQLCRLYLIRNVPFDTAFQPRTRKEIKSLQWFRIDQLPTSKKDMVCKQSLGLNPNAFFMVIPFIKPLRKWVNKQLGKSDNTDGDGSARKSGRNSRSQEVPEAPLDLQAVGNVQWQQQQIQFSQPAQREIQAAGKQKEARGRGRDPRTQSASPPPRLQKQSNRSQHTSSPKSTGKKHSLKKSSSLVSTSSRKSLASQFGEEPQSTPKGPGKSRRSSKKEGQAFWSPAWMNFRLDYDAILDAMFPKAKATT